MNDKRIENTEFRKLIGNWKTEGKILANQNSPEMEIIGTDTYELILNGFFILHKADVIMGNEKSETFELIGLDNKNDQATLEHYNNHGSSGKMNGNLINNELTINGEFLRFKGNLNESENQLVGTWKKMDNRKVWTTFLEMKLTKIEMK